MALYTEISSNVLNNILAADEEDRKRKQLEAYNNQKAQLDNKYKTNGGGLGGFLSNIVGGIGKGIGDVGYALGGMFGTAGASVKDLLEGKAGTAENAKAFKRAYYGAESDKDAAAKAAGNALNAATTLATTVVPGMAGGTAAKLGTSALANTAAGAIGGVADEFAQQGANASLESAANRAISGGVAGLATAGLNRKIGNATGNISSKLLNNKLATSTIGRGALSGAVGGATGAGTSAALGGGDIAGAALQGGLSGAVAGGTQAGLMSGANKLINRKSGLPNQVEEDFRAYGDSDLANQTRNDKLAGKIGKFGKDLEGAQTNITRAAARDLGIDSAGGVVERVRQKTGLTDLDVQSQLARELTGGDNSLLDTIQKNALAATEDGSGRFTADTTDLVGSIESIVKKHANRTVMGGETKLNKFIDDLRNDIVSRDTDLLSKANSFKAAAAELRGKGIVNPSGSDTAKAKIYTEIANKLDDLSYNAIPGENVANMFDVAINEMKSRANQARNNGVEDIANAYDKLADALDRRPRNIGSFRNFKKDFVDVSKIARLTNQAQNGAAFQLGTSAAGTAKRTASILLQEPVNKALAKVGGAINGAANRLAENGQTFANVPPISQGTQNIIGNAIGRTEGTRQAGEAVQNARKAQDYQNIEDMLSAGLANIEAEYAPLRLAQAQQTSPAQAQLADIANGMNLALAAGDVQSYNSLANLYQTAYKMYELQNPQESTTKMTTAEKNQIAKLQSAGSALDELEQLYSKAGGGQGIIGGNIANFLGGLGLNSDVNTYNQLAQGLINQIGAAIGKTDSLNTEGEVQRALSLVPKITDDNQTAMNKLASLRQLLQTNTETYNQLYGA